MSSAQFNAGQNQGQAQHKTEQWMESAEAAHDKACGAAGKSQQSKDQNAGFLQQTGEQVVHKAQGAIDGVKNTIGMGHDKK